MKRKIGFIIVFCVISVSLLAQNDSNFRWVVEPKFEIAEDFNEGLARIKLNGKWGFIDKEGTMIVKPVYDSVMNFSDGLAAFLWQSGKWGYVDKTGKNVIYPQYDYAGPFSNETASILKGVEWGTIDKKGKFVGEPEIDEDGSLLAMLAVSQIDEPQKKMNAALADKFDLDYVGKYNYSLAAASKDGEWGFIDQNGNIVIEMIYDETGNFSNNVAKVLLNQKWGYINTHGTLIIPAQFDKAKDFADDIAWVQLNGKWGIIKKLVATDDTSDKKSNKKKE